MKTFILAVLVALSASCAQSQTRADSKWKIVVMDSAVSSIRNQRVRNVVDFGARADGSYDDRSSIQSAVNDVAASGGGIVLIPPSALPYRVSDNIVMASRVELVGYGARSRIVSTGDRKPIITCDGIMDFAIKNVTLIGAHDGGNLPQYGIEIKNGAIRGLVEHCVIDSTFVGILVGNLPPLTASNDVDVLNNVITHSTLNGIGVNCIGRRIRVKGNYINGFGSAATIANPAAGIEYRGASYGECSDNMILNGMFGYPDSSNFIEGIRFEYVTEGDKQSPDHVNCDGNNISYVNGNGIISTCGSRFSTFSGNIIDTVVGNGMYFITGNTEIIDNNTITRNVIDRAGLNGMKIEGLNPYPVRDNDISGNIITRAKQNGIYLFYHTYYNRISGNIISHCGRRGIWESTSANNIFDGNTIRDCAEEANYPGFYSQYSNFTTIKNLKVMDTRTPAQHTFGVEISSTDSSAQVLDCVFYRNLSGKIFDGGVGTTISRCFDMVEGMLVDTIKVLSASQVMKSSGTGAINQQAIFMGTATKHNGFAAGSQANVLADPAAWGMFGGPNNYLTSVANRVGILCAHDVPSFGLGFNFANMNDPTGRTWAWLVDKSGGTTINGDLTVNGAINGNVGAGSIPDSIKVYVTIEDSKIMVAKGDSELVSKRLKSGDNIAIVTDDTTITISASGVIAPGDTIGTMRRDDTTWVARKDWVQGQGYGPGTIVADDTTKLHNQITERMKYADTSLAWFLTRATADGLLALRMVYGDTALAWFVSRATLNNLLDLKVAGSDTASWLPTWADINAMNYLTAETGDISSVSVTAPVTGGGTSGAVTVGVDTITAWTGLASKAYASNAANLFGTISTDRYSAYGDLGAESKIGTGSTQVAAGDHAHAATYQPLDADLTAIAGLTATTGNMILSAASAWTSADPATVKTALSLGSVTNESKATMFSSPTFTGTPVIPTPFTLGATSMTTTAAKLNYLTSATGTTGTNTTNIVFSASPALTGTVGIGVSVPSHSTLEIYDAGATLNQQLTIRGGSTRHTGIVAGNAADVMGDASGWGLMGGVSTYMTASSYRVGILCGSSVPSFVIGMNFANLNDPTGRTFPFVVFPNGTVGIGGGTSVLATDSALTATSGHFTLNMKVNNNSIAAQFRLSALNTAPANAAGTGTLGEIRITATYIYVCTATNTWVRAAVATW